MKNILLSLLALLVCSPSIAQNRQLENYGFEIKLEVNGDFLVIQNQNKIDSFVLQSEYSLLDLNDTNKVIRALRFDVNHLEELYNQYLPDANHNRLSLIQALAARSQSIPEQRIIFIDAQQGSSADDEIVNDELVPISEVEENSEPSPFGKWSWIGMLIGGIAGGLMVYLLGKHKKHPSTNSTNSNQESAKTNPELTRSKEELANIKATLQKRIAFDEQYFGNSFDTIIKPLEKALEAKNEKAILPLLIQAMSQYSALTRFKLEKKQSFDQANMEILVGTKTYAKSDFPKIDKNTSPDNIPNKLKTLIDLLQKAEATGVDNTVVSGYKIQDL